MRRQGLERREGKVEEDGGMIADDLQYEGF